MTPERWRRIDEVFRAAAGLAPAARAEAVERLCGGDRDLRREVESLLEADGDAEDFMERAVHAEAARFADGRVGTRIGAYEVVRELGRGGMGTVYLAVRADQRYRQSVAVKVLKRGMDTDEILRRFRQERQILASLDHPNISRLLDAATTEDGLPCFVMEHVDGLPIDRYCDLHELSVGERLRLFRTVCSAVEEAHRNLVVHRDLKPRNILVTEAGVPKLLDFGIAKLLEPGRFREAAMSTDLAHKVMTPDYASPEQVRGEGVTTLSDVYSLGVLLYVLLTGERPYRVESLEPSRMEQAITGQEAVRPSLAVGGSARRRRLAGDLDNIVLTALRKDPRERYGSVEQLSEDLRRHLEGLPVTARRPTFGYRVRKFAGRHRGGVAAAVLSGTLLVAGVVGISWQARLATEQRDRAEAERDRAEEVSRFLEELFQLADPSETRGNAVTARELLDRGAAEIAERLGGQPEVLARLLDTMGRSYQGLGLYSQAAETLELALEAQVEAHGEESLEAAETRDHLAGVLYDMGDLEAADSLLREALATRRRILGPKDLLVAQSLVSLAEVVRRKGDLDRAEDLARQALEMWRELLAADDPRVASSLNNLAGILVGRGDLDEAEVLFRQALDVRRRQLGEEDPAVLESLNNMGFVSFYKEEYERAESFFRRELELRRQVQGGGHPDLARSLNNLAKVLSARGSHAAAVPLFRESLEIKRRFLGDDHASLATTYQGLGTALEVLGDDAGAVASYRQALRLERAHLEAGHPSISETEKALERLLQGLAD